MKSLIELLVMVVMTGDLVIVSGHHLGTSAIITQSILSIRIISLPCCFLPFPLEFGNMHAGLN